MKKIFIIMMLSVSLFSAESKKNKQEDKKQGVKCEGKNIVKK